MPGPFPSGQYRAAKKARASASPSKPSAPFSLSSSSRLGVAASSFSNTTQAQAQAEPGSSNINRSASKPKSFSSNPLLKSIAKKDAANALKRAKLISKSHSSKPHSSFRPSSKARGLNLNTSINLDSEALDANIDNGSSSKPTTEPPTKAHRVDVKAIEELTEKSRQAAIKRFAEEDERDKLREKEKEREKDRKKEIEKLKAKSDMPATSSGSSSTRPNAPSGSSSSPSDATLTALPNAPQTATAPDSRQQVQPGSTSNSMSVEDYRRTAYTQPASIVPNGAPQGPMYGPPGLYPYPPMPAAGPTYAFQPPPPPPGVPAYGYPPPSTMAFIHGNESGGGNAQSARRASAPSARRSMSQQVLLNTVGVGPSSQRNPVDNQSQRSPVDPPTSRSRSGTPSAPSHPPQAAPIQQAGAVSAEFLNAMYSAQDLIFGRLNSVQNQVGVLQATHEAHGRGLHGVQAHLQAVQGSVQSVLNVQTDDRRERGNGFETLMNAVREIKEWQDKAKEEQRRFFEAQIKLYDGLAKGVTDLRKDVQALQARVGEPSEKDDDRSLLMRLHTMEHMLVELAEVVEDRGANVPEDSSSSPHRKATAPPQPEAGPSTVKLQLNTPAEPIEIDLDDSPAGMAQLVIAPQTPAQVQQAEESRRVEPSGHASTTTGTLNSGAPDLRAFLLNTQSGRPSVSGAHSPATTTNFDNDTDLDLDLEYPPDSSQPRPPVALSQAPKDIETLSRDEAGDAKTPEPKPSHNSIAAKTPTQSLVLPQSASNTTVVASSLSTTTIISSTSTATMSSADSTASAGCPLDKSRLHFSRVDWSTTKDASESTSPTPERQPYKPDPQILSKTPDAKRVSSTLPPPPAGSIAELRLGVVGCAPYVGNGLIVDQNDRLAIQDEGRNEEEERSVVVPLVPRPSVSPLPSPETTPNASREGTPVPGEKRERAGSVDTVVVDDEGSQQAGQEGMLVDEGVVRDEGMEVDGPTKDDTLDILAANLREMRNLEEEQRRIEAEIEAARAEAEAKEKSEREARERAEEARAKGEREEAERKRKEEEAETKARMERLVAEMRAKRLEREKEKQRAEEEQREADRVRAEEARKEREEKERKDREKMASAEPEKRERHRVEEEERRERERREKDTRAKEKKEAEDRLRAMLNKEAFEREEREKVQEVERQARALLEARREEEREAERKEKEKAVAQEEEPGLQGDKVYDALHGQHEETDQHHQQDYDLSLELEPDAGIDPIYTQLGGPTPARSQFTSSSSSPALRRRLAPSATELEIAKELLSPEIEVAGSGKSPEIEIPKDIDDRVDTSDEGEQDELHDELDVDDLENSPFVPPTASSNFLFHSTPRKDTAPASSSTGEAKNSPAKFGQNRTVTYTPKVFKGARSQPLMEIVTNSPSQLNREAPKEDLGKRRVNSERVSETPEPGEDEGEKSQNEVNSMMPPPHGNGGTVAAIPVTVPTDDDVLPEQLVDDDMSQDEPAQLETPEEQLFLPGDDESRSQTPPPFTTSLFGGNSDDDELALPPPRRRFTMPTSAARSPSEEVPEATSTPKSTVAASKAVTSTVTKTASTSTASNAPALPKTPTRNRTLTGSSGSTPLPLSAGTGIGGRLNSHPASKTLVPTPSRKGALSRRFEEENRNRERSHSISTSVAPIKKPTLAPLPSTPKAKSTTSAGAPTTAKVKKPTVANEVIEILSSPEVSPRVDAQNVIAKRKKKLEAKDKSKLKDGDDNVKVKRESLGGKAKGRMSTGSAEKGNTSNIFIDLTSDKEEEDDGKQAKGGSKAKGKAKETPKAAQPKGKGVDGPKSDSDSDSDPDLGVDTDDSAEIVSVVPTRRTLAKPPTQSQQPSRLIMDKLGKKPGQSAAATRVKRFSNDLKRANDGDSDDERPLKRARELSASRGGVVPVTNAVKTRPRISGTQAIASGSKRKERESDADRGAAVKKEKSSRVTGMRESSSSTVASSSRTRDSGNAKTLRARTVDLEAEPIKWPAANKHGNRGFQRDFIECDKCNGWFHYGCVGIKEDDPRIRLQDPESFMCPKCEMGFAPAERTEEEKERCGRPNCIQRAPRSNEYYVERLVGRKFSGMGASFYWLVKWDGYPLEQSTWQTEKDMTDPAKLIEAFTEVAQEQGKVLSNPYKKVLLEEVEESGWVDPDKL